MSMARPLPSRRPPEQQESTAGRPFLDLELAVVTPLFGGSAMPGEVDPQLPVKAASVRGHLRTWWRACHAVEFTTAAALYDAESRIFGAVTGAAAGPSAINVA